MKTVGSKSAVTSALSSSTSTINASAIPVAIASVPTITEEQVAAFVSAIDTFALILGSGFEVPQPEDQRRLVKARRVAPTIVPLVSDLSGRYGIASVAYPSSVTLAKQAIVNTLTPVAERISAVQKLVGSIMSVSQSGAWEGSMVTYGLLKSESRGNAVLRNALAPVRDKLRLTYETADGTKTKVRSRSRAATAKTAAAKAAQATTPAPETTVTAAAPVAVTPPVAAPAATDAAKS